MKSERKAWIEPIHDILEGDSYWSRPGEYVVLACYIRSFMFNMIERTGLIICLEDAECVNDSPVKKQ